MKVIKDDKTAFLAVAFGLKQRFHAAFTAMLCFDLTDSSLIAPEKEMWETARETLPEGVALDSGMPKSGGEFLVSGQCVAAGNRPVTGQAVTVRVGDVRKSLYVFGNRYWIPEGNGYRISDPTPFTLMPMLPSCSFGGEGHPLNPAGKGVAPLSVDGRSLHPLPNLEYPDRMITARSDSPPPASLLPLPVNHPHRMRHAGTYDEFWLKHRWPWYPDDLDSRFFSCAPEDQWRNGFFTGTEAIEVTGMNPDHPKLSTTLPRYRMRLFVTKREGEPQEERFMELETRIDTVWLLPGVCRGIVIYRGLVDTADDEMSDIVTVFAAPEPLESQPLTLEHYREEQARRMTRTIEIDKAPFEDAQKEMAAFLNTIPDIRQELDNNMAAAFHKAPVMPTSISEKFASAGNLLASFTPLIAQGEALASSFRADYGHLVKIDTSFIKEMKDTISGLSSSLGPMQEHAESVLAGALEKKKGLLDRISATTDELKKKGHADIPDIRELPPDELWKKSAFSFVCRCVRELERDSATLDLLAKSGLRRQYLKQSFLGLNRERLTLLRKEWGLPEGEKEFVIPAGLVIPRFDNMKLTGIAIRPSDIFSQPDELLVPGSSGKPLAMQGFRDDKMFAVVADDLDAALLQQETWDFCSVVSLRRPDEQPDDETAGLMKKSPLLFIVLPERFAGKEESIRQEMEKWVKPWPNAIPVPLPAGENVIGAWKGSVDLRGLLIRSIPPGTFEEPPEERKSFKPEDIKPGMELPSIGAAALVKKYQDQASAFAAPVKAKAVAKSAEIQEKLKETLKKVGLDPEKTLAEAEARRKAAPAIDPYDPSLLKGLIEKQKASLNAAGRLTPEIEAQFDKGAADYAALVSESANRKAAGLAKLEAAKPLIDGAGKTPDWAAGLAAGFGFNPDTGSSLTRKEVLERYARGESLAGVHLEGADLSGLELAGINLEKAYCAKASFAGTDLTGARLSGCIFMEADLSGANIEKGEISGAMFQKAKLSKARMAGISGTRAMFRESEIAGADFSHASLNFVLFDSSDMGGASFRDASGQCATFMASQLQKADFSGAAMKKWVFQNSTMDSAVFRSVDSLNLTFLGCSGERLNFTNGSLRKARFIQKTSFPCADFKDTVLEGACVMESDLNGSDFRGSDMSDSYISSSDLADTNLYKVHARGGRWEKTDLSGADMRGLDLMGGTLRKSRITGADLTWANLYGVEFTKTKVGKTRFDNANLKKSVLENRVEYLDD